MSWMKNELALLVLVAVSLVTGARGAGGASAARPAISDPRHLANGWVIPGEGYADQPYIVRTDDGAWLCVFTTGRGTEGAPGQHVVSRRSTDRGRSWEDRVPIEPADGPEASYAVQLKVPGGRIHAFYNHNTDRVREVRREDRGVYRRVDSLGYYVFKYTDDHGRTWTAERYGIRRSGGFPAAEARSVDRSRAIGKSPFRSNRAPGASVVPQRRPKAAWDRFSG